MNNRLKAYHSLPLWAQHAAVSTLGLFNTRHRYSKDFDRTLEEYMKNLALSKEQLKDFQREELSKLLKSATHSEYWKERFNKFSVNPHGDPYSEIKKLPILTKGEVKQNVHKIRIKGERLTVKSTSGSTGSGLLFYSSRKSEAKQWAVWWRNWQRLGISRKLWCAHFGGKPLVDPEQNSGPYYRINLPAKQLMFSSYHISPRTAKEYIDEIKKRNIRWIHGFPSVISELARICLMEGIKAEKLSIQWITTGAENLLSNQKRLIEEAFKVIPTQHYGLAEGVANFSESLIDDNLLVDEDFAFVEFIAHGDVYRIIGTSLSNHSFPLIRYDTSDLAAGVNESTFPRKVHFVDGRQEDVIQLPSGTTIGRLAQIFNNSTEVDEAQIVQDSLHSIIVKIVKNENWNARSKSIIEKNLRLKLGHEIKITFEFHEKIRRTKSGKLRFIVSNLDKP